MKILRVFLSISIFPILFQVGSDHSIAALTKNVQLVSLKQKENSLLIKEQQSGILLEENTTTTNNPAKTLFPTYPVDRIFSNYPANTIFLTGKDYTIPCPGKLEPEGKARFFSTIHQPAANLRVIIRNITAGLAGSEKPYTNREYFNGKFSEGFLVKFGKSHSNRYLAVQPGKNRFDYIIRNKDKFVGSGEFQINVDEEFLIEKREMVQVEETTCLEYKDGTCVNKLVETSYKCP